MKTLVAKSTQKSSRQTSARRPRFSLRTFLLIAALATSGYGLWYRWDAWVSEIVRDDSSMSNMGPKFLRGDDALRIWTSPWSMHGYSYLDLKTGKMFSCLDPRADYLAAKDKPFRHTHETRVGPEFADGVTTIRLVDSQLPVARLFHIHTHSADLSSDGKMIATDDSDGKLRIWTWRRAETAWGPAGLPEFWMALLFGVLAIWTLWTDRRAFRATCA